MKFARRVGGPLLAVQLLAGPLAGTGGASATPAQPATILDLTGQRKALYESELVQNILLRSRLGYRFILAGLAGDTSCRSHGGSR